jgi:fumarate reductase flavoprotein subunit
MLHKRKNRQVQRVDRATSNISAMSTVVTAGDEDPGTKVPLLIIGAGAAGLCAALSAKEAGVEVVVVEREATPSGSTALSAGLIPAAGTRFQRAKNIHDSAKSLAADITHKANGEVDSAVV